MVSALLNDGGHIQKTRWEPRVKGADGRQVEEEYLSCRRLSYRSMLYCSTGPYWAHLAAARHDN